MSWLQAPSLAARDAAAGARPATEHSGLSSPAVALALAQHPLRAHASRVEISGETLFFYTSNAEALLQALGAFTQLRILHRPANLEDLFLKLTGRQIREDA